MAEGETQKPTRLEVDDLTMAYGRFVVQRNISFELTEGEILVIMGGSGCGKSCGFS